MRHLNYNLAVTLTVLSFLCSICRYYCDEACHCIAFAMLTGMGLMTIATIRCNEQGDQPGDTTRGRR